MSIPYHEANRPVPRIALIVLQFVPSIAATETLEMHSFTEIIGIVHSVGLAVTSDTKYGRSVRKRSVTLVDESFCTIEVTIWGEEADGIGQRLEQVGSQAMQQEPQDLLFCY